MEKPEKTTLQKGTRTSIYLNNVKHNIIKEAAKRSENSLSSEINELLEIGIKKRYGFSSKSITKKINMAKSQ